MLRVFGRLLSFSLFASLVNFTASFLLAYVYEPIEFGDFSLYFAIANVMSGFLFLRADFLIAKNKELEKYAYSLLVYATALLSILSIIISIVYFDDLKSIVVIVWASGIALSSLVTYMCINRGRNDIIGYIRVANAVSISVLQLLFSYSSDVNGLIYGSLLGSLLAHVIPFYFLKERDFSILNLIYTFRLLNDNFKVSLPSTMSWFFDAVLLSIVPVLINMKFGPTIAGFYVFADRIIKSPLSVITSTISPLIIKYITSAQDSLKVIRVLSLYAATVLMFCFLSNLYFGEIVGDLVLYLWGDKWLESSLVISYVLIYHLCYMYNISTMYLHHYLLSVKYYITVQLSFTIIAMLTFYYSGLNWKDTLQLLVYIYLFITACNYVTQVITLKGHKSEAIY
ncbi:MATE family efflux transporter [Vibrio jasicida]|uniref:hypothetical protein n=1 Tax=Vibrio jasicida TaxID=766224 RepID=UPI00163EBD74|nr:hypothetical protein [Vibrio jasicida]